MKKSIKLCTSLAVLGLVGLVAKTNVYAQSTNFQRSVDRNKVWTIKFNKNVKLDDEAKKSIKVVDSSGKLQNVQLQLSQDKREIKVKPDLNGYKPGEKYTLEITKGLKSEKNNELKEEKSIEFYVKDTSFNNILNENTVTEDEDKIYYVDRYYDKSYKGEYGSILYSMDKDGKSKKEICKEKASVSNLNVIGNYIYYVFYDAVDSENMNRRKILKVKKDGSEKPQVVYDNMPWFEQIQIVGTDIYYSKSQRLYKGNIYGEKPIEMLKGIENIEDDIYFLVKDGWIYYRGTNGYTGDETGFYKMKTDGTRKTCLIKKKDFENMNVGNINIENQTIYYYNAWLGDIYKSDLNGKNRVKMPSLNTSPGIDINVYKGNVYYWHLHEGNIYRVKSDGTEKNGTLLVKDANKLTPAINIVNGYLWYYNSDFKMCKVKLNEN